jgi:tetratricopeptide (TPR) repeat protein
MPESSPDSPFAEFATPKQSAVEYLKSRQGQDRKARRETWWLLGLMTVLATAAAAGGASQIAGPQVIPFAFGFALAGSVIGLLGGWIMGAVTWAYASMRGVSAPLSMMPMGQELVRGNRWDRMSVWLSIWGAIGIACGGAIGANKGVAQVVRVVPDAVQMASWGGSLCGIVVGFVVWILVRRLASPPAPEPQHLPDRALPLPSSGNPERTAEKAQAEVSEGLPLPLPTVDIELPSLLKDRAQSKRSWRQRVGLTVIAAIVGLALFAGLDWLVWQPIAAHRRWQEAIYINNQGVARAQAGDHRGAIARYTEAINLNPALVMAYMNRGAALEEIGDFESASADFTKAIELDPRNAVPYIHRGYCRRENGDAEAAIADCTRALEIDPRAASAYANRGNARLDKGDVDGSIADLTRALELDASLKWVHGNRAAARAQKSDWEGAIADSTRALELDPRDADAYRTRGLARLHQGNEAGAQDDFTQFLQLRPDEKVELDAEIKKIKEPIAKEP